MELHNHNGVTLCKTTKAHLTQSWPALSNHYIQVPLASIGELYQITFPLVFPYFVLSLSCKSKHVLTTYLLVLVERANIMALHSSPLYWRNLKARIAEHITLVLSCINSSILITRMFIIVFRPSMFLTCQCISYSKKSMSALIKQLAT